MKTYTERFRLRTLLDGNTSLAQPGRIVHKSTFTFISVLKVPLTE